MNHSALSDDDMNEGHYDAAPSSRSPMRRIPSASAGLTALLFTITTCLVWSSTPSSSRAEEPPTKRALLIGINKYLHVPKLNGSLNDIETMRQVLVSRFGFDERHIATLTDEAATRAGILAALDRLVQEAGPRDTVYLHYSGHGSQVQDLNGDEPDDGLDETLVPQDGRGGNIPDITDDELDERLARLKASSALIVLDSCHSGTATRGMEVRTRAVPQDTRLALYPKPNVTTRGVIPLLTTRYVLMTGAAAHQEALDGPVEGKYHGFFSYALSKSLGGSSGLSPRDVFAGIERELKRIQAHFGRSSMPEPQLEAPPTLLDRPLWASLHEEPAAGSDKGDVRLPWLQASGQGQDHVLLVNGAALGAAPGSLWAVYLQNETDFRPGLALAVVTVKELRGKDALAIVTSGSRTLPANARAVALTPAGPSDRIPVRLRDIPPDHLKGVESALRKQVGEIEIVKAGEFSRFVIDSNQQGTQLDVYASDGLFLVASFSLKDTSWATGLAQVMSRSANASEILALDNPSSQLKVSAHVGNKPAKVASRGIGVVADTKAAHYHIRKSGKPRTGDNSLQLDVQTSADAYLTIVDVDSQGGVTVLFPNTYQRPGYLPDGRVRGGESILIPDSLDNGNQAGFHWDYTPPKGVDTIRVFASTDLETATMIRQRIHALEKLAQQRGKPGVTTRGDLTASVSSLREDLAKRATRGLIVVNDPTPVSLTPTTEAPLLAQAAPPSAIASPSPGDTTPAPVAPQDPQLAQVPTAQPEPPVTATIPSTPETAPAIASSPSPASPATPSFPQPAPSLTPLPDWSATTLTILVEG
jgi:hypothetical protein